MHRTIAAACLLAGMLASAGAAASDGQWSGQSSGDQIDCPAYDMTLTIAAGRIAGTARLVTPQRKVATEWEVLGRVGPAGRIWMIAATFDPAIPESRTVSAFQGRVVDASTIRLKQPPATCSRELTLVRKG